MNYKENIQHDSQNRTYLSYEGDTSNTRIYALTNGLRVYLAKNIDEPRIQCFIAVRAGSAQDPADTTGLAHYMEHMLFKGSDKLGTLDWEKESVLLQKIEALYEIYRQTTDKIKRKEIFKEIDNLSVEASKYSVANEYDKLANNLGVKNTNAHTWLDETIYKNNIPNYALKDYLNLEFERFNYLSLRLFHTELETVYEEYNRAQDSDARLVQYAMMEALFPTHPYGQQTTLGKAEHLKNPSMRAIRQFFSTYYVPNNMAITLVGDLDYEESIQYIEETFGKLKANPALDHHLKIEQTPIKTKEIIIQNPAEAWVQIGFRTPSIQDNAVPYLQVIDFLLCNGQTGLIDLHLNQKQLARNAYSHVSFYNQYGIYLLGGYPIENQSLTELKELLLTQIERIKKGDFDPALIPAVVNQLKINRMKSWEKAANLAVAHYTAFIHNQEWNKVLTEIDSLSIDYQDIINFSNNFFQDNYVIVYKEMGAGTTANYVEKSEISTIELNQNQLSAYAQKFKTAVRNNTKTIAYNEVHFDQQIFKEKIGSLDFYHIPNTIHQIAELHFIINKGKDHDSAYDVALKYIQLLDNDIDSNESFRNKLFKLGANFSIKIDNDETIFSITALEKNLIEAYKLVQNSLQKAIPNKEIYESLIQKIAKDDMAAQHDPQQILLAGIHYIRYGSHNRYRNKLSLEAMKMLEPSALITQVETLLRTPHTIFYYGTAVTEIISFLKENHPQGASAIPEKINSFNPIKTANKFYFFDYDSIQVQYTKVLNMNKIKPIDHAYASLFNDYFGAGLSAIVFQELREKQSLAYAAYAYYHLANNKTEENYLSCYIGTSPEKLISAMLGFEKLFTEFPAIPSQYINTQVNNLQQLQSSRTLRANIFWYYWKMKKWGYEIDYKPKLIQDINQISLEDLQKYYYKNIENQSFNSLIIGKKTAIDWNALPQHTEIITLTPDLIF